MNKEAPVTCSSEHVQTEHVNDNSNSQIPITENNDLPNKENHLSSLLTTVLSNNSLDVPLTFSNIEKDDFVFQMIRGDGNCFYRAFAFSFLKILGEREESFRVKIWNHFLKGVLTIMKNSFKLPSHLNSSLSEIRTRIFDFLVNYFG
ncbi:hypothetical protein C9374_003478 [Naegleria lovaniensis]|uniref:OTU domain-containing protein n=1 Tax=Naegleria lovaniensis TaxID=51637 RepID=A0AA88GTC6_NAELO|nr:uncharacterized protein C9374_003478 [Naegleria lovaniensis]KAG2385663.1 hypothetical protein C9374_003478 [Naegleria lovaniensis]